MHYLARKEINEVAVKCYCSVVKPVTRCMCMLYIHK